jgi:protein involved in polysaccharide export with SLBB domain
VFLRLFRIPSGRKRMRVELVLPHRLLPRLPQVNIWGYVRNPGRYEIPTSTDLVQLISFAGGPIQDANMDKVKITRSVSVDSLKTHQEIFVDMNDLTGIKTEQLALYPGDTIFVDRTGWSTFRDVLSTVSPVAIIGIGVYSLILTAQHNSNP